MSSSKPVLPNRSGRANRHKSQSFAELPALANDATELRRLASLVADGEIPLPTDLPDRDLLALCRHVKKALRQRLVQYVARAIAMDIHRERGPHETGAEHAQEEL